MNFLSNLFKRKTEQSFPHIVAARVISAEKHPNADRLRVIKLDAGNRLVEPVVCGAFNFEAGDMVALALPGAGIKQNIHNPPSSPLNIREDRGGFILEKATIRGIESQGMICAAFELGLGPLTEKPEIMVLKNDVKPGSQFGKEMIK